MSMNNFNPPPPPPPPEQPNRDAGGTFSQEFRHQPVSARVPERVARGVLSTGVLVLDGAHEFIIDFMQGLTRPYQVAARIVLSPVVMEQFVVAIQDNLNKYSARFGPPPTLPKPPTERRPTLQEIYDEFKVSDEIASGTYANAVMVGHSPSEFFFDFITNFYPTSTVSARVFLSAAQLPRMLETVGTAFQRFQQRMIAQQQQQHRPGSEPPAAPPGPTDPPPPSNA
ncbi:MAG: DUF3467 domain-containing protein [Planctomycetota bacterium]|nr:DUF3467 domain-containing protein [Planctomycetota bacterium]